MKEMSVSSFDEFQAEYEQHFPDRTPDNNQFSNIIFRGHRSSSFNLASTLERYTHKDNFPLSDYVQIMLKRYS